MAHVEQARGDAAVGPQPRRDADSGVSVEGRATKGNRGKRGPAICCGDHLRWGSYVVMRATRMGLLDTRDPLSALVAGLVFAIQFWLLDERSR